jgi:DUF438 domain-containing protein
MAAEQQQVDNPVNLLLSDFNTRLREIEERNRVVKERVLLLGQNLISSKEELGIEVEKLKKESSAMKKELDKVKVAVENISGEISKFVKKDEMILIERMLKDFQPLEFVRMKDIEEIIAKKLSSGKEKTPEPPKQTIKTSKSSETDKKGAPRILDFKNDST